MRLFAVTASFSILALAGCASPLKMENVAGTWTCPRVDGKCAGIEELDRPPVEQPRLIGAIEGSSVTTRDTENIADSIAPRRSGDQIARIVFAPRIDADGNYHDRREIFAVMTNGGWLSPSEPGNRGVWDDE